MASTIAAGQEEMTMVMTPVYTSVLLTSVQGARKSTGAKCKILFRSPAHLEHGLAGSPTTSFRLRQWLQLFEEPVTGLTGLVRWLSPGLGHLPCNHLRSRSSQS